MLIILSCPFVPFRVFVKVSCSFRFHIRIHWSPSQSQTPSPPFLSSYPAKIPSFHHLPSGRAANQSPSLSSLLSSPARTRQKLLPTDKNCKPHYQSPQDHHLQTPYRHDITAKPRKDVLSELDWLRIASQELRKDVLFETPL